MLLVYSLPNDKIVRWFVRVEHANSG